MADSTPPKPNIVWVMADDLGSPLSFTGTAGVKTPHIDQLASEGMFFSRYYASAPSCAWTSLTKRASRCSASASSPRPMID